MTTWTGEERRRNRLNKDDVALIVEGVTSQMNSHYCRFNSISVEEMAEVVPFMLSFKGVVEKTGMLIWKIIIGFILAGVLGWTALGFWNKVGK